MAHAVAPKVRALLIPSRLHLKFSGKPGHIAMNQKKKCIKKDKYDMVGRRYKEAAEVKALIKHYVFLYYRFETCYPSSPVKSAPTPIYGNLVGPTCVDLSTLMRL